MSYYIGIIIIGIFLGYIAERLIKGRGYGLIINILLGIGGALLGSYLFRFSGITFIEKLLGSLIFATIVTILILWIANFKRFYKN